MSGAIMSRIGKTKTRVDERHGRAGSPEYNCWRSMIARCHRETNPAYKHYGGRGILVCDEWRASFTRFLSDVGERPSPKHSLDRIDNSVGYQPGNCRWVTQRMQMRNTRRTILITIGVKTQCLKDWCRELGTHVSSTFRRINEGMRPEDAVAMPSRPRLTEAEMVGICDAMSRGDGQHIVAERFNTSPRTVRRVVAKRKHGK